MSSSNALLPTGELPIEAFDYAQAFRGELLAIDYEMTQIFQRWETSLRQRYPLAELTPTIDALGQAMAWPHGGKRLRPLLVLLAVNAFDNHDRVDRAMPTALAIECLHTYSLVHDDLPCMDDDTQRRGKPTTHCEFDEATAVLVGDALQTEAYRLVLNDTQLPERLRLALLEKLTQAAGLEGLIAGQQLDLQLAGSPLSEAGVTAIHQGKTAGLISTSLACGAMLADQPEPIVATITQLGQMWGRLFQVVDDLLDSTATTEALGKTAGKDAQQDKNSLVQAIGLEKTEALANELFTQCREQLNQLPLTPMAHLRLGELLQFTRHRGH